MVITLHFFLYFTRNLWKTIRFDKPIVDFLTKRLRNSNIQHRSHSVPPDSILSQLILVHTFANNFFKKKSYSYFPHTIRSSYVPINFWHILQQRHVCIVFPHMVHEPPMSPPPPLHPNISHSSRGQDAQFQSYICFTLFLISIFYYSSMFPNILKITFFWDVMIALKMEAIRIFETSLNLYKTTWRNIPEDCSYSPS